MNQEQAPYAREMETAILAVQHTGGLLGNDNDLRTDFWAGDEQCATLYWRPRKTVGRKALAVLDFGQRRFKLTKPDDHGLVEAIVEWWDKHRRRLVWRGGSAIVSEIRDESNTAPKGLLGTFERGSFERDGTPYQVRYDESFWHQTGYIKAENRYVGTIESSMESRKQMLITPSEPLRLDVMLIAYHMFGWLPRPGADSGGD